MIPVIVIIIVAGVILWLFFFRKGEVKAKDEFEKLKEKWLKKKWEG